MDIVFVYVWAWYLDLLTFRDSDLLTFHDSGDSDLSTLEELTNLNQNLNQNQTQIIL